MLEVCVIMWLTLLGTDERGEAHAKQARFPPDQEVFQVSYGHYSFDLE